LYESYQYEEAMKYVEEIINRAFRIHPELQEQDLMAVVQNKARASKILKDTCIVEALNMKASILYLKGNLL